MQSPDEIKTGIVQNEIAAILGKHGSLIYQIALRMRKKMNTSSRNKDESGFNTFLIVTIKSFLFTLGYIFHFEILELKP